MDRRDALEIGGYFDEQLAAFSIPLLHVIWLALADGAAFAFSRVEHYVLSNYRSSSMLARFRKQARFSSR